jgi:hypothetical protein
VVSCGGFGAARTDERDGAKDFNDPFDLGLYDGTDAPDSVAVGNDGSNASNTLVHDGTDAADALVMEVTNSW